MRLSFRNKKITGLLIVLPSNEVRFEDEMENYNFSIAKSLRLKAAMGYNTRRIFKEDECVSDVCVYGLEYLFTENLLNRDEIDALILVTQSPDHIMPPTSNIIQGKLGLKTDMICLDINQGCTGFIVGLTQAFMLLDQPYIKKVVVLNADILSRRVSKQDRNSNPLIGDGASIAIVERSDKKILIEGVIHSDGTGAESLMVPAGGLKLPVSEETGRMEEDAAGNFRSKNNLVMKGDDVFNFVQREVPPMIDEVLNFAVKNKDEIDYYLFHQPNKFMLNKLADKIGVPREKVPSNVVENFGNGSGITIPTAIVFNLGEELTKRSYQVCLAGFGVGLMWGALVMEMGPFNFNKIITK
jgi:3-oxoacyl-[acyl-carrier-protein] synthase-3